MAVLSAPRRPPATDGASAAPVLASPSSGAAVGAVRGVHWKSRIAFLWLVLAVGMSARMILAMMEPGVLTQAVAGKLPNGEEITTTVTLMFALFWLIPLIMGFLTLATKETFSRPANAIVGLLASVVWFTDYFEGHEFGGGSLVLAALVIAGLLIVWHAWKWPQAGSSPTPTS